MGFIGSVSPEIIATANVGCMLQYRAAGIERAHIQARGARYRSCSTKCISGPFPDISPGK